MIAQSDGTSLAFTVDEIRPLGFILVSWVSFSAKAARVQRNLLQTNPCGVAGNVVLYNVALLAQHGASALSAVWNSGTFWSGPQPFSLHMQSVSPLGLLQHAELLPLLKPAQSCSEITVPCSILVLSPHAMQDCNLVFYDSGGANQANAIFYTATYDGTGPCALSVSGSGGGFITVADSNHTVLYLAPTGFGVLIDAGINTTYSPPGYPNGIQSLDTNEVYNVATGVVSQAATNLNQEASGDRTFLPTIGAVLSIGSVGLKPDVYINTGPPYVNSELFLTASQTWASAGTPVGGNTDELGLVTLHSGDAL